MITLGTPTKKPSNGIHAVPAPHFRKVTLCGSTRFKLAFVEWNACLTLDGYLVYSVALWAHSERFALTPEQKQFVDVIHFAKIRNSDEIFVLDIGGYVGDSTRREISYAEKLGKKIRYLSREFPGWTETDCKYAPQLLEA